MKKILLISMVLVLSIKNHAQEITQIPDPIFEQILIEKGIDTDGVVNGQILTSDAEGVTNLEISDWDTWTYPDLSINDLTGIESFINLDTLIVNYTYITDIQLNTLTQLKYLDVAFNDLATVDVTNNPQLRTLNLRFHHDVWPNNYEMMGWNDLDFSQNPELRKVIFSGIGSETSINLNNGNNHPDMRLSLAWNGPGAGNNDFVCIKVDDAEAAQAGAYPYSEWIISVSGTYHFTDDFDACFLSIPKEEKLGISVYPNPVSELINFENLQGEVEFILYDLTGKKLVSETLHSDNSRVDVNFLSEGLYVYRITDSTGRNQSGKLVKE